MQLSIIIIIILAVGIRCVQSIQLSSPIDVTTRTHGTQLSSSLHSINHQSSITTLIAETSQPVVSNEKDELKPIVARVLLLLCCMFYGSNYATTKFLQEFLPPTLVTTVRFLIGSLFFIPSIAIGLLKKKIDIKLLLYSIEVGVWCSLGFIAQAVTLNFTAASKVSLFSSVSVVLPPIYDYLYGKLNESTQVKVNTDVRVVNYHSNPFINQMINIITSPFVCPVLALVGAAILEWGPHEGIETPRMDDFYLLLTPLSFALTFWRSEKIALEYPNDIMVITGVMLATVTVISCVWSLLIGEFPRSVVDMKHIVKLFMSDQRLISGMLVTGVITTAWTSFIEQKALRVLSAADTTLIYSLEPLFASFFAWFFVGEVLTLNIVIGAIFILSACLWDFKRQEISK